MNPFGCLRLNDFILFTCLQQKFAGLKITSICRFAIFKTFATAKIPDFFSKNTLMEKNQKKQPHQNKKNLQFLIKELNYTLLISRKCVNACI